MTKKKVLVLHGYSQNPSSILSQVSPLVDRLGLEPVALEAPIKLNVSDLPSDFQSSDKDDMRSWFAVNKKDPSIHYNMNPALEVFKSTVAKHGPFAGIIGFSQGSAFSSILCGYLQTEKGRLVQKQFEFAILVAGFIPNNDAVWQNFFPGGNQSIKGIRSIHILGETDQVVPNKRSQSLSLLFEGVEDGSDSKKLIIFHDGGHYVPRDSVILDTVYEFLNSSPSLKSNL